jgi:hypothetical protein
VNIGRTSLEVFEKIYINEDGVTGQRLREPFSELVGAHEALQTRPGLGPTIPFALDPTAVREASGSTTPPDEPEPGLLAAAISGGGWSKPLMVGAEGLEPPTCWL